MRVASERTGPATFKGLNEKMFQPGGITRPLGARERKWATRSGKANFVAPTQMFAGHEDSFDEKDVLQLVTFRSNGQFNTTEFGTVTIPAGQVKAKIKVKPINGSPNASTLKLKVQLLPPVGTVYTLGTATAKLKLIGK